MNSRDYQRLSLRTVPEPLAYWTMAGAQADFARRQLMCNCALGMAGEAAEIEETPTSDEIGDGYWYAYILLHVLSVDEYEARPGNRETAVRTAHRSAGAVCELVKKHVFHGREFDVVADKLRNFTRAYVDALATLDAQTAPQTRAQNVAKLEARYPAGFFERG